MQEGTIELIQSIPANEYEGARVLLMRQFTISERWADTIEYYLLFNKLDVHEVLPKTAQAVSMLDRITGRPYLSLRIGSDTEQRDILEEWASIEAFQGIVYSQRNLDYSNDPGGFLKELDKIDPVSSVEKLKAKKNRGHGAMTLDKYKRVYELRLKKKSYSEIAEAIGCSYYEVGTYLKRFREAINGVELD